MHSARAKRAERRPLDRKEGDASYRTALANFEASLDKA
jgi:hypothetical protein